MLQILGEVLQILGEVLQILGEVLQKFPCSAKTKMLHLVKRSKMGSK